MKLRQKKLVRKSFGRPVISLWRGIRMNVFWLPSKKLMHIGHFSCSSFISGNYGRRMSYVLFRVHLPNCINKKKKESNEHWYLSSTGRGEFIVGVTEEQTKVDHRAGQFIGLISYVNIFNKYLDSSAIKWMSQGCGLNPLNAIISWSHFKNNIVGDVNVQKPALCLDNEGG